MDRIPYCNTIFCVIFLMFLVLPTFCYDLVLSPFPEKVLERCKNIFVCGGPIGLCRCSVPCAANNISHRWSCFTQPLLDIPESRLGDPWYGLALHFLLPCRISRMSTFSHPWDYGTLQLRKGYVNPWGPWCITSLKGGGCCVFPGQIPCFIYWKYLYSSHSLPLIFMKSLKSGYDEV